ncbi:protein of unknown function [Taphrina deformans PYCC 5710]|uniref:Uncharacterized protein n=1 Tax=Taphrina deformans (strain PYCC 5710 / ATCC 11124 / CBS 356.35 / IMI 108563 / JCM 9778 / NBRC 8474) TaxID=1097556 RepID=R4XC41_TAPDE|nr:protein of unknown function [Taphrina deformans PYCC 5710]|eukprot:CCG83120.1 protein of unknown function [Taphrina deformans PYCC 5710]
MQMLTPKTPERRNPMKRSAASAEIEPEDETDWDVFTNAHIGSLSDEDVRSSLKKATKRIRSLERDYRQSRVEASHHRFNHEMLRSEEAERTKRAEVEHLLMHSSQALLCQKLSQSAADEETFRHRHIKAKRRVAELSEDTKRQQLSIDHLQQALSSKTGFLPSHARHARQRDGGLDVLSDAAGLAQLRDRDHDHSSGNESPRPQSGPLLSPVAFGSNSGVRDSEPVSKRRKLSKDSLLDHVATEFDDSSRQLPGRRLTFNSSGDATVRSSRRRITPITPKSPQREKLQASAMS